jgi:hypothetical protein
VTDTNSARRDVEDLIVEGFHAVDTGHATRSLATDDFEMILPNMTITGEQYRQFLARREQADYTTRHCVSNVRVLSSGDDQITLAFVVAGHRLNADAAEPIVNVADFVDRWITVDGSWRHRSRSITPAFPVVT